MPRTCYNVEEQSLEYIFLVITINMNLRETKFLINIIGYDVSDEQFKTKRKKLAIRIKKVGLKNVYQLYFSYVRTFNYHV